ncbi:DnaJ domain-containing protein [Legionella sp. CNM-1927-20]|uniref:DnaJ domain-containing protein n=1 Tax=Legionella sp. CNM-1927-20 TaxID=3422221 RepID=UPI00403AFA21
MTIELLFAAARTNNTDQIKQLVNSGVNINQIGLISNEDKEKFKLNSSIVIEGITHLTTVHIACLYGHLEALKTCIALGANINIHCGISATHCAIIGGNGNSVKMLDVLIENGADLFTTVNASIRGLPTFFNQSNQKPTKTINYNNLDDLLTTITEKDCDISKFIQAGALTKDEKGSCLYQALALRHLQQINQLLAAHVNVKEKHYYAAGLSRKINNNSNEIYNLLPQNAITPNNSDTQENSALTALIQVIKDNKQISIKTQLTPELIQQDVKGSCLYFALLNNNQSVAIELLKAGALVKNKHYYAAGMAKNGKKLFEILKDSQAEHEPNFKSEKPHEILGVSQYASEEKVKSAYKKLIIKYHPDKLKESETKEISTKIINAYKALKSENSSFATNFGFYASNPFTLNQGSSTDYKTTYSPN